MTETLTTSEGTEIVAPALEVRDIAKTFGHVQALLDVSFSLKRHEVVALLGDNGAGKSTLVKILAGVFKPDAGQILMNGVVAEYKDPSDAIRGGIATVFQELAVVDSMDVARNIYLGLIPRRFGFVVDYGKMYADAAATLQALHVDIPSVYTRVRELSGGQRQAVAIARALAQDASVLLFDEPTAALGVVQTSKVNELIADLKTSGKTILMITHNLAHVFEVADRLVVLRRGQCVGMRDRDRTTREEIVGLITGAISGDASSGWDVA
jgi:ABC-type sugar transport system ATPase subunit